MRVIRLLTALLLITSCSPGLRYTTHKFPEPVDTRDVPIEYQLKKTYQHGNVYADNEYDGARINDFVKMNDTTYRAIISPENKPINESAYYSFRIWSDTTQEIELQITYTHHPHRYIPKISTNGTSWIAKKHNEFDTLIAGNVLRMPIVVGPEKQYVSAQELFTSGDMARWCTIQAKHADVRHSIIGQSKLDRPLHFLDIYQGEYTEKPAIIIIARQHPPEIPGQFAMNAFVDELMKDTEQANAFRSKYRILVYPMMNPDGVDLGHWRHSAGGVDMNRDWGEYQQTEVAQMTRHSVDLVKEGKNEVLLGIDFHSTQEDVFYTLSEDHRSKIYPFKDQWYAAVDSAIDSDIGADEPYPLNQPISKGWFYLQFGAEGITYEVGDETPRHFVIEKAQVAARAMMDLLPKHTPK